MDGVGWLPWLPFGRDVHFLPGEGSEAVVGEEGRAVLLDEALDGLTPPAGVSVAAALQHQRPADTHTHTHTHTRQRGKVVCCR